jgi:hypothetical protein
VIVKHCRTILQLDGELLPILRQLREIQSLRSGADSQFGAAQGVSAAFSWIARQQSLSHRHPPVRATLSAGALFWQTAIVQMC